VVVKITDFVQIPKTRVFAGKRYKLMDAFVSRDTAGRLKARYKRLGYLVRVYQDGSVMHFLKRFHVYVRKGK